VADAPSTGVIEADRDLLRRLLDNLMDNAVRHTPAGGRVTLTAATAPKGWTLSVADTGPGIAAEARQHVFERFYRADTARERGSHGAGLGLSLCSAIVRLHAGSIEIADPGSRGGTRVVVSLPA
jgi:two-component system, OmpR family, sensor histidine kinase BaeS